MPQPQRATSIEELMKKPGSEPVTDPAAAPPPRTTKLTAGSKSKESKSSQEKLDDKMEEIRLSGLETIAKREAEKIGLPYINLAGFPVAPEALSLIPREEANKHHIIAFLHLGDELRFGTTQPSPEVDEIVKRISKEQFGTGELYYISESSFRSAERLYDALPEIREVVFGYRIEQKDLEHYAGEISNFRDLQKKITEVSTTDVVTLMIGASLKSSASDIHVEAEEEDIKIRFRIDGILQDVATLAKTSWQQIISRLKLLAGVKINIMDVPQDGRITIYLVDEKIDIRVSFLPTAFGESVVMRLLRPKSIALEFVNLGIRGKALQDLSTEVERPNGMIITTGPTGSGKTTTLYAILQKLNTPDVKIITLEDPIEYKLKGINQSQIQHDKGYTFAMGLRAILRQDPDVVMVGEIRDLETAETGIQAALTGHLVISTIHTNSAAGVIPRFISMGVKPFLLAPALNAVIGQRLVRKLCQTCKQPMVVSPSVLAQVKDELSHIPPAANTKVDMQNLTFFAPPPTPNACTVCNGLGYKGRIGIYEIFTMNKEVEEAILAEQVSASHIEDIARKQGMITMVQDGLLKAMEGLTSVEEVLRVAALAVDATDASEPPPATV
ncbi:MAG: GspE/PulE family protein [Candidatus Uhrbacteria bacterium]|nr:GspE/PulE family protein [Candidatus Uhrbacteria bacterium]